MHCSSRQHNMTLCWSHLGIGSLIDIHHLRLSVVNGHGTSSPHVPVGRRGNRYTCDASDLVSMCSNVIGSPLKNEDDSDDCHSYSNENSSRHHCGRCYDGHILCLSLDTACRLHLALNLHRGGTGAMQSGLHTRARPTCKGTHAHTHTHIRICVPELQ